MKPSAAAFLSAFSALGALVAPALAAFTHDGTLVLDTYHPCTGNNASMLQAALPKVIQMAQLARTSTDESLFRKWFGACDRGLINSVYDQIIDYYPTNENFQCMDPSDAMCRGQWGVRPVRRRGCVGVLLRFANDRRRSRARTRWAPDTRSCAGASSRARVRRSVMRRCGRATWGPCCTRLRTT